MSLDQTNVFVKYLPADIDDNGLRGLFSPLGEIISAKVMIDHQTGLSLGYGFVRFASPDVTQEAIVKMTGHRVNNKVLLCKLSNSSTNSLNPAPSTNLYIRPLPLAIDQENLRQLFAVFGTIKDVKVMVDKVTGESIQIGFTQEAATAALNSMNGQRLDEDEPPITVKYAETEQQRIVRKSRVKSTELSPPSSPTSTTYYYPGPAPQIMYPLPYVQVPTNYAYTEFNSPPVYNYVPIWVPYGYNVCSPHNSPSPSPSPTDAPPSPTNHRHHLHSQSLSPKSSPTRSSPRE